MTLGTLSLFMAVVVVLVVAVGAVLLRLTAKIVRVEGVTWKRIVVAAGVVWLVHIGALVVEYRDPEGGVAPLFAALALLVAYLAVSGLSRSGSAEPLSCSWSGPCWRSWCWYRPP